MNFTSRGVPPPFWWWLATQLSPAGWGSCWGWPPASPPGSLRWTRNPRPARGCTPSRASSPVATAFHQSSSAETNRIIWENVPLYGHILDTKNRTIVKIWYSSVAAFKIMYVSNSNCLGKGSRVRVWKNIHPVYFSNILCEDTQF